MNRNKDLEEAEIVINCKQNSIEQLIQIVGGFGLKVCIDNATGEVFTKGHPIGGGVYNSGGEFNPGGFNAATPPVFVPCQPQSPHIRNDILLDRFTSTARRQFGDLQKQFTEMANRQQEGYTNQPPAFTFATHGAAYNQSRLEAFVKFKKEFNEEFFKDPILGKKYLEKTNLIVQPDFHRSMIFLFDLLTEPNSVSNKLIALTITDCFFYGFGKIDVENWSPDSQASETKIDRDTINSFLIGNQFVEDNLRKPYEHMTRNADNYTKVFFSVACLLTDFYNGKLDSSPRSFNIKNIFYKAFNKFLETVNL